MPGITLFNRRWNLASDDLFYPGLFELIGRFLWFIPQLAYYIEYKPNFECYEADLLHIYYLGYLAIMSVIILLQLGIVIISTRGNIMYVEPRRHINKFLYARTFLVVFEFVWSIVGIIWLTKTKWSACSNIIFAIVLSNICFCLFAVLILAILLFVLLDPISHLKEGEVHKRREILYTRIKSLFFCCYCCLYNEAGNSRDIHYENSYKQISSILEMVFRGGNLTPSDVLAGIILLNLKEVDQYKREIKLHNKLRKSKLNLIKKQKLEQRLQKTMQLSSNTNPIPVADLNDIPSWMNVNEAAYYIRYAVATYSWPYYVYMHNARGLKEIFCSCQSYKSCCCKVFCCCCTCCKKNKKSMEHEVDLANSSAMNVGRDMNDSIPVSSLTIHGDTRSQRYFRAFKFLSKINDCDLIYANFQNELFLSPFCIVVDHFKRMIVLTIRGSLSIRDVLTDLTAECEYFDVNDEYKNQSCHRGILNTAENILARIKNLGLLDEAFRANPNYQLMICGHSLGAGAAVLISLKLRNEYPNLRCIAYSPPGGLINTGLSDYTKSFVMSVVTGDDIVPRLSLRTIHNLKADILKELYNCQIPKYKIIWKYSLSFVSSKPQFIQDFLVNQQEAPSEDDEEELNFDSSDDVNIIIQMDNDDSELEQHSVLDDSMNSQNSQKLLIAPSTSTSQAPKLIQIKEENNSTKLSTPALSKAVSTSSLNRQQQSSNKQLSVHDIKVYTPAELANNPNGTSDSQDSTKVAIQQVRKMIEQVYDTYPDLTLPGHILYIYRIYNHEKNVLQSLASKVVRRVSARRSNRVVPSNYDFRWASREEFKKILITNRTLIDHFPNSVEDALKFFNDGAKPTV